MEQKDQAIQPFIEFLSTCIEEETFVKLTLSKPANKQGELRNIYIRLIELKGEKQLSFTYRFNTRDEVKNQPVQAGIDQLQDWLGEDFLQADLFSTTGDWTLLYNRKRQPRLLRKKPSIKQAPSLTHDREKNRFIETKQNRYLQALGILNQQFQIIKSGQRKYKQINKYIEILDAVINQEGLPNQPHIVDMGSGKGYLTFALYDYLNQQQKKASITGIELRPKLVEFCNQLAQSVSFDRLQFLAQDIHDYHPERIDMLIALHACDIATDIAIAKGIKADAQIIIVAPCCHKQIRQQMNCQTDLQSILRHGILEERQAELVTDGIRALLLEDAGYQTKVFEFISNEHTSKNLMIVAVKGERNEKALEKVQSIKESFGVDYHYLEKLLESN